MSMENLVVWQSAGMPTMQEINVQCRQSGHLLEIDPDIDLSNHSGFLPAKLESHDTGFELYFLSKNSPDLIALDPFLKDSQGVMSVTAGNFRENLAALIFLQAVSRLTGGAYLGLSFDIMKNSADAPAYLQTEIDGMRVEVEREDRRESERHERQMARMGSGGSTSPLPKESEATKSKRSFWSRLFGQDT